MLKQKKKSQEVSNFKTPGVSWNNSYCILSSIKSLFNSNRYSTTVQPTVLAICMCYAKIRECQAVLVLVLPSSTTVLR